MACDFLRKRSRPGRTNRRTDEETNERTDGRKTQKLCPSAYSLNINVRRAY